MSWLAVLFAVAYHLDSFSDELTIVEPARDYIRGDLYAAVRYPSFVFYFYGSFFRLFGTINNPEACLHVARIVNYLLFVANILLLHAFLRRYFPKLWALVGTILFTTLPPVVFSALYVKTEGLLLCQLLFVLLALARSSASPNELRWHALAALGAGLSLSTKLSPLPFLLYVANAIYLRFHGTKIALRAWLLFCGTLLVVVLASWTNLWIFNQVIASWKSDIYFLPGAGPFNAVTEGILSGFPYGRFSSFVTVTMPMSLGLVGMFFVASILVRSVPRWIFWVFGGGNLASLTIGLSTTRLRLPHGFTPHMVFFVVAGISFLAWLGSRRPASNPIFNSRLAWVLVAASLSQTAWQTFALPSTLSALSRVGQTIRGRHSRDLFVLMYFNSLTKLARRPPFNRMKNPDSLREFVSLGPGQLYVFSSTVDNMCKYSLQSTYRDNCDFFYHELLPGKTAYQVERRDVIPWRGYLLIDPEFSHMSFFLLTRTSR